MKWLSKLGLVSAVVLTTASVLAYNIDARRWVTSTATLNIGLLGTAPSGKKWSTLVEDAMAQWSTKTDFEFITNQSYVDPCAGYSRNQNGTGFPDGNGDGRNGIDFGNSVCGNAFGNSTLAITLTLREKGTLGFDHIYESDIIVNNKFEWDSYNGPLKFGAKDFNRVVLHELGHMIGLNHENVQPAIMAATVSELDSLQADDIAGANAIYGGPRNCLITEVKSHSIVSNALNQGDCRVLDLFGGGDDTSYVDTYRLKLTQPTRLRLTMRSSQLDSVLILTDSKLVPIDAFDDTGDSCDVDVEQTLPAGEYLLLANTYVEPDKCGGNTGNYTLTIRDSNQPILGSTQSLDASAPTATLITGGASSDGGLTYKSSFNASELFSVAARLGIDPQHVGQNGKLFVLVKLSNGQLLAKNAQGQFVAFNGDLSQLPSVRSGPLAAIEALDIAQGVQGRAVGLAGLQVGVYIGYAVTSNPGAIYYGSQPISFSIGL
jgi:hypothetical protein